LGGGYNNGSFIWGRIELERIFNIELGRIINEPGVPQSALADLEIKLQCEEMDYKKRNQPSQVHNFEAKYALNEQIKVTI
jgi:hypothetical protein